MFGRHWDNGSYNSEKQNWSIYSVMGWEGSKQITSYQPGNISFTRGI